MDKKELTKKLKSMGVEVVEGKVRKSDLEKVVQAAKLISEPKSESSSDGQYEFSFAITEDYSQRFLNDTKGMTEDDAYDYYDAADYISDVDAEDTVWEAIRRLFGEVTAEGAGVEGTIYNLTPIPDDQWTREKAAEALKTFTMHYRVNYRYELAAEQRTKLETAAAEAIKNKMEA